eukprot:980572_1
MNTQAEKEATSLFYQKKYNNYVCDNINSSVASKVYTSMNKSKSCSNKKRTCNSKHLSNKTLDSNNTNVYHFRSNDDISLCDSEASIKYVLSEPRKRSKYNTNNLDTTVTLNDLMQSITLINLNSE